MTQLKNNILFYALSVILIAFMFFNPFAKGLESYLEGIITSVSLSLGLLSELKFAASAASSERVPFISGISASTAQSLTEAIQYLSWSDIFISIQLILINLSKSALIKVLAIGALLGSLIAKYRDLSLRILVILLLINPGLPAYVSCVKYLALESKLVDGDNLTKELQATHAQYQKAVNDYKAKEESRKQKQFTEAKAQGKEHIDFIEKIEDKTIHTADAIGAKTKELGSETHLILKKVCDELIVKALNLFTSVLIQFALLPFVFFYGVLFLFKRFMSDTITDSYLEKIILGETALVLVMSLLSII